MARSLAKMLISRRNNFSTITRYFTDNSTTQFKVGDEVKVRRTVTVEDVTTFAQLTGDTNPIHLDEHFAKKTELGQLVVHGVILNGIVSAVHGTKLPGPGCMVVSQSLNYPAPLFPGEEVLTHIRVTRLRHAIMICDVICTAVQRRKVVLCGETKLLLPKKAG
ncbi:hydroxyacyl-thioester dehydratase type 2, mitochondrial-like [Stylophora pistillata]|uniref:hydroxyacyl-thioester dehydratase type 2, mitochondrial-like n=1 Tax=Stylophora pistillata TaxID=50429 RepID=UPI000C0495BD|nr:hydroxyacyl-thioester dehydratase type 2, mitochondrial-like [Stylophora pistillata]